ncbi:MAG: L,D-transpeptidase family protein, partial [Deltaproteobacteria bacterium]|nr:L,D-transpeptidase family protein [Deltaproteobacteria bacterium]
IILLIFLLFFAIPSHSDGADYFLADVRDHLRQSLEDGLIPPGHFYDKNLLSRFYEARSYRPAWIGINGIGNQADDLMRTIYEADREGLSRNDYHYGRMKRLSELIRDGENVINEPALYVELEFLMTDAFFVYAFHLLSGHVNPETIQATWRSKEKRADLVQILQEALESGSVRYALKKLTPFRRGYSLLRYELMHYSYIARRGGWEPISEGPAMRRGDRGKRVELLRKHLVLTEDIRFEGEKNRDIFDEDLEAAVVRYQRRHGLSADGVVGPETLAWHNIPADELVKKIRLNMERWRWLARDRGEIYIVVNIADFKLDVINNDESELSMRVIVGTNYRRTPVFSSGINRIIVNPYWYVPPHIAVTDVLPEVKKNPDYLAEKKMRIYKSWNSVNHEIDPATIDWPQVNAENFDYMFRQDPGPLNPLGKIKFLFPNKFSVYLHDTPARNLFEMTRRGFSSGCIRLEKPAELADYLLKGEEEGNREDVAEAIEAGDAKVYYLPEPVPLYLIYWTAWVDNDMQLNFRDDIYNRDILLSEALNEKSPVAKSMTEPPRLY